MFKKQGQYKCFYVEYLFDILGDKLF